MLDLCQVNAGQRRLGIDRRVLAAEIENCLAMHVTPEQLRLDIAQVDSFAGDNGLGGNVLQRNLSDGGCIKRDVGMNQWVAVGPFRAHGEVLEWRYRDGLGPVSLAVRSICPERDRAGVELPDVHFGDDGGVGSIQ